MLLLFPLLACTPDRVTYDVTFAEPETDCPAEATPGIASSGVLRFAHVGGDSVRLSPVDEYCAVDGTGFACELEELDAVSDYWRLDEAVEIDVDLAGVGLPDDAITGEARWSTTCEGADCDALVGIGWPACTTTWSWTGVRRDEPGSREDCDVPDTPESAFAALGSAPWDPFVLRTDEEGWSADVTVVAEGLGVQAVEPHLLEGYVDADAGLYRVEPEPYDVTLSAGGAWLVPDHAGFAMDADTCALPGVPRWASLRETWTVGRYGRDPEFAPEMALGVWNVEAQVVYANGESSGLGALAAAYHEVRLEVLAVGQTDAEIRLVYEGDHRCVVLHDDAELSATGDLTWSRDRVEVPTQTEPLVLHAPRFRLGFDSSRETAAGGEVTAVVDFRVTEGTQQDACEILPTFGDECAPCPDDGHPSCIAFAGVAWTATRVDEPAGEALPTCGVDFTEDTGGSTGTMDCDGGDGGTCALASLLVVAPALRRRRRPRA